MASAVAIIRVMSTEGDCLPSIIKCSEAADPSSRKGRIHRPVLKKILKRFKGLCESNTDDFLSKVQLRGQNFVIAYIGLQGGKISFPDGSVQIDVPPRALTKPQPIYCCRADDIDDSCFPGRTGKVFYSVVLRLGSEEMKFTKKIHLRFQHFSKFENEDQKKQLAAFVQQDDSDYQIDTNADLAIGDDDWVELQVETFCNRAIGADERINLPPPPQKCLAASFLSYEEFSKKTAVKQHLLIGPADQAHMKVLCKELRDERTIFGQGETVKCSPEFEKFNRQATSELQLSYQNAHYIAERADWNINRDALNSDCIVRNPLKREQEAGFESKESLCTIEIAEVLMDRSLVHTARFPITWQGHEDPVEPEERVLEEQGQASGEWRPPFEVSGGLTNLAEEFGLQQGIIEPSSFS